MAVMQSSGGVLYVYFVVLCQCTNCSLKHVYIVFFYTVVHIVILYRCTHLFLTHMFSVFCTGVFIVVLCSRFYHCLIL